MEKVINRTDIVENIISHQHALKKHIIISKYDIKLFRVIVSMYLEFMIHAVLKGISWELPKGFGIIRIIEKTYDFENKIPFKKPYINEKGRVYTNIRPGFVYQMIIESKIMDKVKCKFKPSLKIKSEMYKIYTDKEQLV